MTNMPLKRVGAETQHKTLLYLNLRPFFLLGLSFILLTSPLMRGLFFQPELLTYQMLVAIAFIFCIYDQVLRREVTNKNLPLSFLDKAFSL